jgi:UDP-glucose 4-epimerase
MPSGELPPRRLVVGGAGFIGSHVVARLLAEGGPESSVVVYDNLSSGSLDRLPLLGEDERLSLVEGDVKDLDALTAAAAGADIAFHFAANPDIAAAVTRPSIDFWEGTLLAQNVLEALRVQEVPRLVYASGSGVYGDLGTHNATEDHGPLLPISTYGASKLGCEALISSYTHMFGLSASAFRFANVVGPRQTHGVTYDFVRRLLREPNALEILGDGSQSKSYIHVEDVVDAMMLLAGLARPGFEVFNVGTDEYVTVTQIAELVVETLGLDGVELRYGGGDRGWKGDVPVVRFASERIRALGWANTHTTTEALRASIEANLDEARAEALRQA